MTIAWQPIEFNHWKEPTNIPKDRTVYVCQAGDDESIDTAGWSEKHFTWWKNSCGLQFMTHWADIAEFSIPGGPKGVSHG